MDWNEFTMPMTVPRRPTNGAGRRHGREDPLPALEELKLPLRAALQGPRDRLEGELGVDARARAPGLETGPDDAPEIPLRQLSGQGGPLELAARERPRDVGDELERLLPRLTECDEAFACDEHRG